jgi:hypothetical protein
MSFRRAIAICSRMLPWLAFRPKRPEHGLSLAFVPHPIGLAADAGDGFARSQSENGFVRHRFEQAKSDQGRRKTRCDHRVVAQRRVLKICDGDDRRSQPDRFAVGQRRNLFAPFDVEPAFRRHDTLDSEDLQLVAVIGMRPRAVRVGTLEADADDHVRRGLERHRNVVVPHHAVHAGLRRTRRCRRQAPPIVGVASRAGLCIRSRAAAELCILEPEERPAVVEHLLAECKQFGLFCIERGDRMQVGRVAGVIVAEISARQRLFR